MSTAQFALGYQVYHNSGLPHGCSETTPKHEKGQALGVKNDPLSQGWEGIWCEHWAQVNS